MAPYDSDSSDTDLEDDGFTETNVLLGYASPDPDGEEVSRLGGRPDWLDPVSPPSAALARCKVCEDLMVLLLQLNAELPDHFPGHERRLYVFTCRRKSCRRKEGSIRAIRGVRVSAHVPTATDVNKSQTKDVPPPKLAASQGLGEALFGVKPGTASGSAAGANPFATSPTTNNPFAPKPSSPSPSNPFAAQAPAAAPIIASPTAGPPPTDDPSKTTTTQDLPKTFAQTLQLNNPQLPHGPPPPPEPWPEESAQPAPYPVRWLADAEYETLDPTPAPDASATTAKRPAVDDRDAGASGGGGGEDKEVFESSMDAVFQKFADRVGQNPEQCIRYEFRGAPLLYSKGDAVGKLLHDGGGTAGSGGGGGAGSKFPRCGNCGAGRVFEVQLMPRAIQELEVDEDGLDGMDWGTIIVGVCEQDCQERGVKFGEAGYVEEWAGVQWEELTMRR